MIKTIVHHEGAAALTAAGTKNNQPPAAIKLGLDLHAKIYVVVAQHDHAALRPPRRFAPAEFVPWVEKLLAQGHTLRVVYEACGFGFGLCRALRKAGAHCHVIAPRKLDEQRTGVKTDARDAATLCQRLSRYLDGNTRELAVIRVPTEEEEKLRHIHRQRESLVRHRTKLQAQGRGLLVNHSQAAPPHWWRSQAWNRLQKLLPDWLLTRLEVFRPVLAALDTQIAALSLELEAAAPKDLLSLRSTLRAACGRLSPFGRLPHGLGKLTSVVLTREVCDWKRFRNRRQVASYTGLCPGRAQFRQQTHARQRHQAWQSALKSFAGGTRLAAGPLPAHLSTGAGAAGALIQRRPRHRRAAQESHRRRRAAPGHRPLATPHRPVLGPTTRLHQLNPVNPASNLSITNHLPTHALERGARSQPNLSHLSAFVAID